MPFTLEWTQRGVIKRFHGHLSGYDLVASAEAVGSDPRYDRLRFILNDFTAIGSHAIDAADIEHYASLRIGAALHNRHVLSPFVAQGNPGEHIARCLQTPDYENGHPVETFPDLDSALHCVAQRVK